MKYLCLYSVSYIALPVSQAKIAVINYQTPKWRHLIIKIIRSNVLFKKPIKNMYMIMLLCPVSVMDQATGKIHYECLLRFTREMANCLRSALHLLYVCFKFPLLCHRALE